MALASCRKEFVMGNDTVVLGEVGLSGEVRGAASIDMRLAEACRLGFKRAVIPAKSRVTVDTGEMELIKVSNVREAIRFFS